MANPAGRSLRVRPVTGADLKSAIGSRVRHIVILRESIPAAVRWLFMLFVVTIPFEAAGTNLLTELSIARLIGLLFVLIYFFYYNPFLRTRNLPPIPSTMWWFLGYIAVYILNCFFVSEEFRYRAISGLITLAQLIVFFWIASSLLEDDKIARKIIIIYSVASTVLALGVLFQLPGFSSQAQDLGGRVTGLGENPNSIGELMALAAVGLIGVNLSNVSNRYEPFFWCR